MSSSRSSLKSLKPSSLSSKEVSKSGNVRSPPKTRAMAWMTKDKQQSQYTNSSPNSRERSLKKVGRKNHRGSYNLDVKEKIESPSSVEKGSRSSRSKSPKKIGTVDSDLYLDLNPWGDEIAEKDSNNTRNDDDETPADRICGDKTGLSCRERMFDIERSSIYTKLGNNCTSSSSSSSSCCSTTDNLQYKAVVGRNLDLEGATCETNNRKTFSNEQDGGEHERNQMVYNARDENSKNNSGLLKPGVDQHNLDEAHHYHCNDTSLDGCYEDRIAEAGHGIGSKKSQPDNKVSDDVEEESCSVDDSSIGVNGAKYQQSNEEDDSDETKYYDTKETPCGVHTIGTKAGLVQYCPLSNLETGNDNLDDELIVEQKSPTPRHRVEHYGNMQSLRSPNNNMIVYTSIRKSPRGVVNSKKEPKKVCPQSNNMEEAMLHQKDNPKVSFDNKNGVRNSPTYFFGGADLELGLNGDTRPPVTAVEKNRKFCIRQRNKSAIIYHDLKEVEGFGPQKVETTDARDEDGDHGNNTLCLKVNHIPPQPAPFLAKKQQVFKLSGLALDCVDNSTDSTRSSTACDISSSVFSNSQSSSFNNGSKKSDVEDIEEEKEEGEKDGEQIIAFENKNKTLHPPSQSQSLKDVACSVDFTSSEEVDDACASDEADSGEKSDSEEVKSRSNSTDEIANDQTDTKDELEINGGILEDQMSYEHLTDQNSIQRPADAKHSSVCDDNLYEESKSLPTTVSWSLQHLHNASDSMTGTSSSSHTHNSQTLNSDKQTKFDTQQSPSISTHISLNSNDRHSASPAKTIGENVFEPGPPVTGYVVSTEVCRIRRFGLGNYMNSPYSRPTKTVSLHETSVLDKSPLDSQGSMFVTDSDSDSLATSASSVFSSSSSSSQTSLPKLDTDSNPNRHDGNNKHICRTSQDKKNSLRKISVQHKRYRRPSRFHHHHRSSLNSARCLSTQARGKRIPTSIVTEPEIYNIPIDNTAFSKLSNDTPISLSGNPDQFNNIKDNGDQKRDARKYAVKKPHKKRRVNRSKKRRKFDARSNPVRMSWSASKLLDYHAKSTKTKEAASHKDNKLTKNKTFSPCRHLASRRSRATANHHTNNAASHGYYVSHNTSNRKRRAGYAVYRSHSMTSSHASPKSLNKQKQSLEQLTTTPKIPLEFHNNSSIVSQTGSELQYADVYAPRRVIIPYKRSKKEITNPTTRMARRRKRDIPLPTANNFKQRQNIARQFSVSIREKNKLKTTNPNHKNCASPTNPACSSNNTFPISSSPTGRAKSKPRHDNNVSVGRPFSPVLMRRCAQTSEDSSKPRSWLDEVDLNVASTSWSHNGY